MSTAPADNAHVGPIIFEQPRSSCTSAEIPKPHIPQMSGIAHSRASADSITGGKGAPLASSASSEGKKNDDGVKVKTRSVDYILRSGLAGGLAGCAGKTVVAPLDRVKILFQSSNPQFAKYSGSWAGFAAAIRDIKRYEGASGLFKGHSATLLRIFPYAAIKFLAYEQIRAVIIPSHEKETPIRRLVSGSMAGITSVLFTYPLELIRVRLAFETKASSRSSLTDICRQIYFERTAPPSTNVNTAAASSKTAATTAAAAETVSATVNKAVPRTGIANFYRGFGPTILGMLPYAGISFLTHDTVGDWLRLPALSQHTTIKGSESKHSAQHSNRLQLTAAAELLSGAVAGIVSQTASYPLEVIRRRMQVGGAVGDGHRLGFAETGRKIFLERGFRGFFVGLTIGYLKIIPMSATSFFVYERVKWSLGI